MDIVFKVGAKWHFMTLENGTYFSGFLKTRARYCSIDPKDVAKVSAEMGAGYSSLKRLLKEQNISEYERRTDLDR